MQKTISKRLFTTLITVETMFAAFLLILPVNAFAADDAQTVTTDYAGLWTGDITLEKGVTTKWYINVPEGTTLKGCGATVQIPGLLDEPVNLTEGENFIYEFTPDSSDDILFACSMGAGCHKNYIRVTENDAAEPAEESKEDENTVTDDNEVPEEISETVSDEKDDDSVSEDVPETVSDETDDDSVSTDVPETDSDSAVSAETSETVSDSTESNPKTGDIGFAGALTALIGSAAAISALKLRRNRSHK